MADQQRRMRKNPDPARLAVPPRPLKTHAAELPSGSSAIDAFKRIVGALLAQLQANRQGVIEGRDPEYLHHMRVAVRRLRAVLAEYARTLPTTTVQDLRTDIQWLASALGPARDADVFITEIWPPLRDELAATPLRDWLDAQWDTRRRAAHAKARRALTSRRYQRLMRGFGNWLSAQGRRNDAAPDPMVEFNRPARDFAHRVIARRDSKVRKRTHALMRMDDAQLHALRIRIKKLRYVADSFGSLFDSNAVQDMANKLAQVQDVLGAINDVTVAKQQVAGALKGKHDRAVDALRAGLADWCETRTAALRKKLRPAWRAYRHAKKFW